MYQCPVCSKQFSRKDNMLRHVQHKHRGSVHLPTSSEDVPFRHPFTMQITAPSMGGKTTWLHCLLCERHRLIHPVPQRIIFCYSQNQPAYSDIKTIIPDIEFVRGIPDDLEDENYLDSEVTNMIILDDVMSEAKDDKRVANLFTKGSHHRNLSVVYLTQNLFPQGRASRDIALNCQYLLLFNNPVDRQQIHLLARRIQPSHPERFMKVYEAAVYRPYGNLLVDLKANTQEKERLKPNILEQQGKTDHTTKQPDRDTTEQSMDEMPVLERENSIDTLIDDEMPELTSEDDPSNKQVGGALYTEYPPPWYQQQERFKKQEGRGIKRPRLEETEDTTDHKIWKKLFLPHVIEKIKPKMEKRIKEYQDMGEKEGRANILAFNENLPEMRKIMMQQFVEFILKRNALEKDSFYRLIMDTAQRLSLEYRLGSEETWKKAAEMRVYLIDDILPYQDI